MAEESTENTQEMVTSKKHYGIGVAAIFVVGTVVGTGILAYPQATVDAGWAGIPTMLICGCIATYTGILLGKCWTILRSRYPEYSSQRVTAPYPAIGLRAAGKVGEYATRISVDVALFGSAIVHLLLLADNITNLLMALGGIEFYPCYMLLIVYGAVTPLSWLGTPKDFWQAGLIAAATSAIGSALIVVGIVKERDLHKDSYLPEVSATSYFNAFGSFLWAFAGANCFPTIQVDMAKPKNFPMAATIGIIISFVCYIPVGISGFVIFGNEMKPNVLDALTPGGISYAINFLITSHLLMSLLIVLNPVTQEIEGYFKIPDKFSWKRVLVRTVYMSMAVFCALTVPRFYFVLSLVGGSATACSSFIFPVVFYYLLSRQKRPEDGRGPMPDIYKKPGTLDLSEMNRCVDDKPPREWVQVHVSRPAKFLFLAMVVICIGGGISSTYFAFYAVASGAAGFTVPCYVNMTV